MLNLISKHQRGKEEEYQIYIDNLKEAALVYVDINEEKILGIDIVGNPIFISLDTLVKHRLLREPIVNLKTNIKVSLSSLIMVMKIKENSYDVELMF